MNKLSTCAAVFATACVATSSASATNILGIDVSSAQGKIKWTDVKAAGVDFAFCRATTGYEYSEDSSFTNNMVKGKAAGVLMGAYEFSHLYADTPAQEANYFWNFAGAYIKADGKSLDPAIDFEIFSGHDGASSYTAWFNDWATDVKAKTASFMHPVIYASACGGMCGLTTACGLSEWVANYNGENIYTGGPWNECTSCNYEDPGGSSGWTYWQASDTGAISGISGNVDLDAYPLSAADLEAYQGVGN